ncbi:Lamin-C [Orchesella cincta]|uniref:Lamin-C n=1 Tax=Orchesella cincta TaxID=48709 RepID=A0A1D2N830_ORCCI|nr:Lamin-C [Orchesella cincta]
MERLTRSTRSTTKRPATTATKAVPLVQTPVAPPDAIPVQSPAASARISRDHERIEIASLNDRFAAIIERNRYLESVNKMLKQKKSQIDETAQRTVDRLKATYDKELAEIRGKGEVLKSETAELRAAHNQLEQEYNETKAKYDHRNKTGQPTRRQVYELKSKVLHLQGAIPQMHSESERLATESHDLKQERKEIAEEIEEATEQLEQETMGRRVPENALKETLEELKVQDERHKQEMKKLAASRRAEMQEVDGQLRQRYEYKLQESLQELRTEYEEKLKDSAMALEARRGAMGGYKAQLKQTQEDLHKINVDTAKLTGQLETVQKKNAEFEKEKQGLLQAVDRLEEKNWQDHAVFGNMVETKEKIINDHVAEKEALVNDTQLLMSTKVALDNEISTYRKLLDGVEQI